MRLIKIKLKRSIPFWTLSGLILNTKNPVSDPLDVDGLNEQQVAVINKAIAQCEILVFDMDGNNIKDINSITELNGYTVSTEDVEDDFEMEVQSVTVSLDEDEDEETVTEELENPMEQALIIINKNGNTVKKTIAAIDVNDSKNKVLLQACLSAEIGSKNRAGIIDAIQERIGEYV